VVRHPGRRGTVSTAAAVSTVAIPAGLRERRSTPAERHDNYTREQGVHRQLSHGISPVMSARVCSAEGS
jgi:hypothetical protein